MIKYLLFFCGLFFLTCGSQQKGAQDSNTIMVSGPDGVKGNITPTSFEKGEFTNGKYIGAIMNYLASDELNGREAGSEGIALAATYIENKLNANKVKPYFSSFKDTLGNYENTSYNIVGLVEGNDPYLKNEYLVIGAHYDHIGVINPENGDAIANGANDNASGTATVLELARYFGNFSSTKRSLIFAFFSAEEKGLLGSKHLATKLKEKELDLYTMLNFEMTGVPLVDKDYDMYITGYDMSNLAAVSNDYANSNLIGFLPTAKEFNLFQRSDNYPFYNEFAVPSHTFCTFDFTNFDHYHKVGDEVELMDFDHMAKIVNKIIPVIEGIANASTKEIKIN
ncbi:MAG: M20/M25/M40 family metallo-hydrolase [Croceitalea sp.]|nr:M20/M25/M40 family metallo-hydrolase [Croceitalea sp.]